MKAWRGVDWVACVLAGALALTVTLIMVTAIVNVATSWRDPARRPSALRAGLCVLVAVLLTAWIVVHVNLRLFFGPVRTDLVEARSLAWQWLALNAIRMGLLGITIVSLRRAARG